MALWLYEWDGTFQAVLPRQHMAMVSYVEGNQTGPLATYLLMPPPLICSGLLHHNMQTGMQATNSRVRVELLQSSVPQASIHHQAE